MRPIVIGLIALSISACAQTEFTPQIAEQLKLDAISDECELDRAALQVLHNGELQFQPARDAKYEAVDCAIKKLKEQGYASAFGSFVGKEQFSPDWQTR